METEGSVRVCTNINQVEVDDEGIIRQRLLAKETVLKRLTKRYLTFCNAVKSGSSESW
jgi:GH25 family lysozyme M1 (1,4-beta-N-acetylmuramidase)